MDIILATHADNPSLALSEIVRYADGSGYSAQLFVRSGWVSADYTFYFETEPLREFISGLERIDRTLAGTALLKPLFEPQFVEVRGLGRGRISVSGDLIQPGELDQRVRFAFETDQTCLRPFAASLRDLVA